MAEEEYKGPERRKFVRLDYTEPLNYKICRQETISKLFSGYTQDISQSGLLCKLKESVPEGAVLWLSFDMGTLALCREIEARSVIIQRGVLAEVVRVSSRDDGYFDVGVCFLTRQEKEEFIALCNRLNEELGHS